MTTDPWLRATAGIIATIAVLLAVAAASSVVAPVAASFFIVAIVWPLQSRLESYSTQLLALAITVLVIVVVFFAFASVFTWSMGRIGRSLTAETGQFQLLYTQAITWLERHGVVVAGFWAEHFNVAWLLRTIQGIATRLNATTAFWLVTIAYVILGLLEVDALQRKLNAMKGYVGARILLSGGTKLASKLRRYIVIRTAMSLATGTLVWALTAVAGLPLALEWGVVAFVLNYIPFIGPFIATVLPSLFALTQFESLTAVLIVFAGLNVIQFTIGSYIEPRVAGRLLAISPFVTLFSVFFWTYLWGFFGAFIGVPITIAILTFCAEHPASRWLSELLGATEILPVEEPTA